MRLDNNNKELIKSMLKEMPQSKKEQLNKALDRNLYLTSSRTLSYCELTVCKEGWLVKLEGTRCSFTVWAYDRDGQFEFGRKPNEDKLHKLYECSQMNMDETYYDELR